MRQISETNTYTCDFFDVVDFLSQHTHVAVDMWSLVQCQDLVFSVLQESQGEAEQHLSHGVKQNDPPWPDHFYYIQKKKKSAQ